MVVPGLVLAVLEPSLESVAVTVFEPAVFAVTEKVLVPATRAALAGSAAFASELVIAIVSVEVTGFQFASTALTVTVKLEPAVCADGLPVLPEADPGAAVSPGISSWSFAKAPALMVVDGLVLAVLEPSVESVAVTVALPAVLAVTENVFVPATSAAFAGSAAFASELVIAIVSVEETTFQFASTALTVTLKLDPAVCALGALVFPVALPGEAVSPGIRICSFANVPALIVVDGLVLAVLEPSVESVAVTVALTAVFAVTENVFVPATSAAFAGSAAFASELVIAIVSVDETTFQFASTALTVTVKLAPAVCALGALVLPVALPGEAVSPGIRICSFAKAPALIVVDGLVLAVLEPSVESVAVTVALPAVFAVTENVFVPATSAAFAGSAAFASELVIAIVSVDETTFQLASTALTVTVKLEPAVCALGALVLPVALPGEAVSPGIRICSFAKAPALIVVDGLVLAVFEPSVESVAVIVALPAVFAVTENVFVPATSAAFGGSAAFKSELVIATVSVEVTGFQLASTALTVTVKLEPAACALGAPVLPVALPGEAVSPGISNCSLLNAPALIVVDGLVLAVLEPSLESVAVTVFEPAVFAVTENVCVPATSAALAGSVAFASELVIAIVSVEVTGFQLASTALRVAVKLEPAVCALGAPVLPVPLPGEAVSPGISS